MANFTDEQITQLSGNQNVQWVSRTGVQFHPGVKAPGMGAKEARETDERHLPRQWHRPGYSGQKAD